MKPFGHKKKDAITCEYGCCYTFYNKKSPCRGKSDRRRRKTARQATVKFILQELMDEQIAVNIELAESREAENDWLEQERDYWFDYIDESYHTIYDRWEDDVDSRYWEDDPDPYPYDYLGDYESWF